MKGFILAHGRSGTKWSATALDRCTDLDARHESMRHTLGPSFGGVESNGNFWRDADRIRRKYPSATIVHQVRDGRDVVRSKLSQFPGREPERAFDMWVRWNERMIADVPDTHRFRLEDLTTEFPTFLHFAEMLGAKLVDRRIWEALRGRPVNPTRHARYPAFADWPEEQQALFWRTCGETMDKLGYARLERMPAWHFEDEYGSLDYTDAVVLDIGADYGCTAEFFLSRGAARVIASERNPEWRKRLAQWAEGKPVTVVSGLRPENAGDLLFLHRPDIVKVDCEGCEEHLLGLDDSLLGAPRAWVMETHTAELYEAFRDRLDRLGYVVSLVRDFGDAPNRQGKVCKIITATREAA